MNEEMKVFKMDREAKIWQGLNEHYNDALAHFPVDKIVCLALQGSQNYGLDTEDSDIDSKLIVTPSFRELAMNEQPVSRTFVRENNEHIDEKDVRLYIETFRKGNMNFLEILFTDYVIVNPSYEEPWNELVDMREEIAHMNPYRVMNAMLGMSAEKNHALQHRYPAKQHIIDEFGYDGKQLSHQERIRHAMMKYAQGDSYWNCIHQPFEPYYLKMLKRHGLKVEEAVAMSDWSLAEARRIRDEFNAPNEENKETLRKMRDIQFKFMEISMRLEGY